MIRLLLLARHVSFAAVAVLLVLLLAFGERVGYEQSIKSFFADDDPDMAAYQDAAQSFGDDNFVFIAYDDPDLLTPDGMDRVAELAEAVGPAHIEGVFRVESLDAMPLLWKVDDTLLAVDKLPALARNFALAAARKGLKGLDLKQNAFTVGGAVRSGDEEARAALKERLTRHPLFEGTVIGRTGTTTAVVVRLKKTEEHDVRVSVAALRARADAFAARHRLGRPAVVGPPVLLADGFTSIERDGRRLAVVGMLLIGLVTLSATQSFWWALVPILSGWVVWLATEEVMAHFHLKLSLSGGPLVAQIIVLTMPAASHLAIHFRDARRRALDPWPAAVETLRAVSAPILWCAITGAIGYGALVTSDVVPIVQFGAILSTCTLAAALLVMALAPVAMLPESLERLFRGARPLVIALSVIARSPALLLVKMLSPGVWMRSTLPPEVIPPEVPVRHGSTSRVAGLMNRLTGWAYRHPLSIVAGVVVVVLPLSLGIFRLRYESNYINLFQPETRVVRDYHTVESKLGGIGLVELIVPVGKGQALDPATLGRFRDVEASVLKLRPKVAHVLSLATVLDPDGRLSALPADAASRTLAAKLDLIAASPQADLLNGFWNPETGRARILVRLLEQQPAPDKTAIFHRAVADARAAFGGESYLTGLSYLMTRTTEAVIVTQWSTFLWSAVGILLMLTVALRGPVLAALALLPTLLAVAFVLGLMGWLGIKLDMATALVASVALGLSVDDTFHCLLQFHRERATQPFARSLFDSYVVTGPGVLLSSLSVAIGFLALRLSEFTPFVNFGTMVGIATAGSTLGNLVLLPACLTLGERLRGRAGSREEPVAADAA